MKAAAFDYYRAQGLDEATRRLADGGGSTKLMAGGQSLGPMLNLRLARPAAVVDVSGLQGFDQVFAEGGTLVLGAGVTHAAMEDGLHPALRGHPMQQVAAGIAYRAIRTRGTLGGSLAHADPAADWMVTLMALGAELDLRSPRGTRRTPLEGFMLAAYTTALQADEIIAAVRVPTARAGRWGYFKFCRKPGEFAEASAAVWLEPDRPTRIALGALDGAPQMLSELAERIDREGQVATSTPALAHAVGQALPGLDPIDQRLLTICLQRALTQAGLCPQTSPSPLENPR